MSQATPTLQHSFWRSLGLHVGLLAVFMSFSADPNQPRFSEEVTLTWQKSLQPRVAPPTPPGPKTLVRKPLPGSKAQPRPLSSPPSNEEKSGAPLPVASSYLARIHRTISEKMTFEMQKPQSTLRRLAEDATQNGHSQILFRVTLTSTGAIEGIETIRTSGRSELDSFVKKMILAVGPFETFPSEWSNSKEIAFQLPLDFSPSRFQVMR